MKTQAERAADEQSAVIPCVTFRSLYNRKEAAMNTYPSLSNSFLGAILLFVPYMMVTAYLFATGRKKFAAVMLTIGVVNCIEWMTR